MEKGTHTMSHHGPVGLCCADRVPKPLDVGYPVARCLYQKVFGLQQPGSAQRTQSTLVTVAAVVGRARLAQRKTQFYVEG